MKLWEFSISQFKRAWNWPTGSETVGEGRIDKQNGCTSTVSPGNQSQMRAGKNLERSSRLSACPKAGAALPTSILTDVWLPCIRHLNTGLGACPGDEKTGYLQATWQAFPWAWHSIFQHLETWEHLLSTRGEQSSVTLNPSIHILIFCGWLHCHQHSWGTRECKVTSHPSANIPQFLFMWLFFLTPTASEL